jgi:hypothetical protein
MAGLQETASRPSKNSVFCARPSETGRDSDAAGWGSWLELRSLNSGIAESAYCETSSCHIGPECHIDIDNAALIRIAHCDDKADNDESDPRTV